MQYRNQQDYSFDFRRRTGDPSVQTHSELLNFKCGLLNIDPNNTMAMKQSMQCFVDRMSEKGGHPLNLAR